MTELKDRIAIVTGASSGIGRAIAEAFSAAGATVVLAARRAEGLNALCQTIRGRGARALALPTDVSKEADVVALFARTMEEFGRLDVLVNNAGINVVAPPDELALADWQRVIDVNLTGAFLCTRQAMKLMKPRRSGRIINIGSISARVPRPHQAAYTTSKFALEGLTRSTALDGREHGIAVSILHPGNTQTPIWAGREEIARREGIIEPADLARVAVLMASLPPEMNLLEAVALPVAMPFLGRG